MSKKGNKMSFKKNQVAVFHFKLTDGQGEVLEDSNQDYPMAVLLGTNHILPKLEEHLGEMQVGDKSSITLAAKDAYGEYKEENIQQLERSQFPEDVELHEGMEFIATEDDGKQAIFYIIYVGEDEVSIDFNLPLAGRDLKFDLELLEVRDASPEELEHGHAHAPGHHHH